MDGERNKQIEETNREKTMKTDREKTMKTRKQNENR